MTPSDLPREIPPSRDLWPDIAARLDAPEAPIPLHRHRSRHRTLVFASLVVLSAAAAFLGVLLRPAPAPPPVAWDGAMDDARTALADTLEARRDELDPVTIAVVQDNLRILDEAIAETRQALTEAPDDADLQRRLAGHVHRRADLVDVVRDLPPTP